LIRTAWKANPGIAVHLAERIKLSSVVNEISQLIKANPSAAMHCPEALRFLVGDGGPLNKKVRSLKTQHQETALSSPLF